ncbi:hypothetical protein EHQ12_10320 [Leptospira gomenensis]|uniref:Uncharacterized protein n=1 Tax=Leptospira gomenensis TaxID=2484974 RepID=A0A5F1YZA2_9LEPT|nr:hypothetical protein [Leptospira gomenensis]TGK36419.1 hypothetical protein EHQ17_03885 [Leptospira gomenensis]TGK38248.1 hypothetical protein EHQ12_10320 [Leptospira gomenensis]TGK45989.1 hypothetical protein EHQ07_07445 [Leptospira gomenensis]TGK65253.1 hypothetical protein EHQ13_05250 [Leptospira gomenensis]
MSISFLQFCSCSFLIWKNASLTLERGWSSSGKRITQTEVLYQEKDSWNPLTGTSLKRHYNSIIRIFDPDLSAAPVDEIRFPSWILPGSVYYHSETETLYWIGGRDDEYGSFYRIPTGFDLKRRQDLSFEQYLEPGEIPIHLVPSPNGLKIAMIVAVTDEDLEFLKPELVVVERKSDATAQRNVGTRVLLSEWKETPAYKIRWSADSSVMYIQILESVFSLHIGENSLKRAKKFPQCFSPPTSFGAVGISASTQTKTVLEKPDRVFTDSPYVRSATEIKDCRP